MSEKYYMDNLEFEQEDGENVQIDLKDAEAVNQDGGELNNTIVTYDDNTTTVSSWTDFINNFVSGTKVGRWFKDFYAGCRYILHVGSLVNNCVTDNADLPLSAAQGKVLMDELTQIKSDLTELGTELTELNVVTSSGAIDESAFLQKVNTLSGGAVFMTLVNNAFANTLTGGGVNNTSPCIFFMASRSGTVMHYILWSMGTYCYVGRWAGDAPTSYTSLV